MNQLLPYLLPILAPFALIAFCHLLVHVFLLVRMPRAAAFVARNTATVTALLPAALDQLASGPNAITLARDLAKASSERPDDPLLVVFAARAKQVAGGVTVAAIALFISAGAACLSGCAAFWAALPTVVAVIETGNTVLSQIESWVDGYFRGKPDAALQAKIDAALTKARDALVVLEDAARATTDVHDGNVGAALSAFDDAYTALLSLVSPIGVHAKGAASATEGPSLEVPPVSAFGASR